MSPALVRTLFNNFEITHMHTLAPVDWDYSALAPWYELRAPYATIAIESLLTDCAIPPDAHVVDIGAGTGRLTRWLSARGHAVDAIEPCASMRELGIALSPPAVHWHDRTGTATGLEAGCAQLVTYGSSFNVLEPGAAVAEALRLLGGDGHVLLLYNHRALDDELQARTEALFRSRIPSYSGGSRRQDPLPAWRAHADLRDIQPVTARIRVRQPLRDFVDGFRAHGTLIRQLGAGLDALLQELHVALAADCAGGIIEVPFDTRAWCFKVQSPCK